MRYPSEAVYGLMGNMMPREPNGTGNGWRAGPAWIRENAASSAAKKRAEIIGSVLNLYGLLIDARNEIAMRCQEDGGDDRSERIACRKYDALLDRIEALSAAKPSP